MSPKLKNTIILTIIFFQLSAGLRSHPVSCIGYFNDIEFGEAIEALITPLYSEQLRRRLFDAAVLSSSKPNSGLIKADTAARIFSHPFLSQ